MSSPTRIPFRTMETRETNSEPYAPASSTTESPDQTAPSSARNEEQSASGKVDPITRFLAFLIDGVVASVLSVVPVIGGIAGAAYLVVRDGLDVEFMNERSLGKRVMDLHVVRLDGQPMDVETSARRNWMWGIGGITGALAYIPILGWVLIPFVALVGLAIGVYEGYRVLTDPEGRRWGDQMAQTKVTK